MCFSGLPNRAGNRGRFSSPNMFPMQTVTGCPSWPVTQNQVYLKAYRPARGPHTVLPLSVWLCCRCWQAQSIVPSLTCICWIINSSDLSRINQKVKGILCWKQQISPSHHSSSLGSICNFRSKGEKIQTPTEQQVPGALRLKKAHYKEILKHYCLHCAYCLLHCPPVVTHWIKITDGIS